MSNDVRTSNWMCCKTHGETRPQLVHRCGNLGAHAPNFAGSLKPPPPAETLHQETTWAMSGCMGQKWSPQKYQSNWLGHTWNIPSLGWTAIPYGMRNGFCYFQHLVDGPQSWGKNSKNTHLMNFDQHAATWLQSLKGRRANWFQGRLSGACLT